MCATTDYIRVRFAKSIDSFFPGSVRTFFFYLPEMFDAFLERNVLTQLGWNKACYWKQISALPCPPQWFKHYDSVCLDTLRPPRRARVSLVNMWWQQLVCGQRRLTSQDMLISLGDPAVGGPSNKVLRCCLWHSPVIGVHARPSECVHTPKVTMILFSHQSVLMQHQRTRR